MNSNHIYLTFQSLFITPVGHMHYLQDSQTLLFNNFFIKNGSHGSIYTFKNYFTTVFSIFNKNKLYSNRPINSAFLLLPLRTPHIASYDKNDVTLSFF